MNRSLQKQVWSELHKTYRALDPKLNAGRRNRYTWMYTRDVKDLNKMYKALDVRDLRKARSIFNRLDTDVWEQIPTRVLDYLVR